jgi:hypothetical protein
MLVVVVMYSCLYEVFKFSRDLSSYNGNIDLSSRHSSTAPPCVLHLQVDNDLWMGHLIPLCTAHWNVRPRAG